MKFGIITPVYDKCFESTQRLYEDLQQQTHEDWVWFVCSNGFSKKFYNFAENKNKVDEKKRIVYVSTSYIDLNNNCFSILANIGKRRNLCIKKINCDYLFLFDADAKILDKKMFETLNQELTLNPKKLCLYHIKKEIGELPLFPIIDGKIDLLNFCVSADVVKKIGYPTTVDYFKRANDFKFFVKSYERCKGDAMVLPNVFCEYNGNNMYKNARKLIVEMENTKFSTTKEYLHYSLKHYPLGLLKAIKDYPFVVKILPYRIIFERDLFFKSPSKLSS